MSQTHGSSQNPGARPSFVGRHGRKPLALALWLALLGGYGLYAWRTGSSPTEVTRGLVHFMSIGALGPVVYVALYGAPARALVVITDDNRYAYATSFGDDGAISSYKVRPDGSLALLNSQEETAGTGTADSALSADSKYLYVRDSNRNTIAVFEVENDGGLTRIQEVSSGSPTAGALGIAAK